MQNKFSWLAAAAALALATPAIAVDAKVQAEKDRITQLAPNTLAGTIVSQPTADSIVVQPYGQQSPVTMRFQSGAPVFQGKGQITSAGLMPGVDVRLHYRPEATGPTAYGVDVLAKQDADAAKKQPQLVVQNAPPATPVARPTAQPTVQAPAQVSSKFKDDALKKASGNQAGKVKEVATSTITFDPYQVAAGDSTLKFDAKVPVFRGNEQLATSALTPGTDVRVYYKGEGESRPRVVAVEVLSPQEAQSVEAAERNLPKANDKHHK